MNADTITLEVDDILDTLGHGEKWTQGAWTDDSGAMCLHQGVRQCQPIKGDAFIIEQVARAQGWGTDWNDEPGRTFDDIKSSVVEHREILPHELKAVFGPQWQPIIALVRRAAVPTEDETEQLEAAMDAADEAAARRAAWAAARRAAQDAAVTAAGDAAEAAARNAARDAAGDAARALAIRDLISQHGFTQYHYDTLTGPWAAVIGPAHPEDAA